MIPPRNQNSRRKQFWLDPLLDRPVIKLGFVTGYSQFIIRANNQVVCGVIAPLFSGPAQTLDRERPDPKRGRTKLKRRQSGGLGTGHSDPAQACKIKLAGRLRAPPNRKPYFRFLHNASGPEFVYLLGSKRSLFCFPFFKIFFRPRGQNGPPHRPQRDRASLIPESPGSASTPS